MLLEEKEIYMHKRVSPTFPFLKKWWTFPCILKKNKGYLQGCFVFFQLVLLLFLGFCQGQLDSF
jgi:hypothetical protein